MTNLASIDMFPNHFVITIFDESMNLIDSCFMGNFWTKDEVNAQIKEIEKRYNIEKWISAGQRKIMERNK